MSVDEVQILPDPGQHEVLVATLERVNRVSNAARAAALARPGGGAAELRDIVSDEIEQAKLPGGFHAPIVERVQAALDRQREEVLDVPGAHAAGVGVQVVVGRPGRAADGEGPAHDPRARRHDTRRTAAAARRAPDVDRLQQRRVRALGRRRRPQRRLSRRAGRAALTGELMHFQPLHGHISATPRNR